jgi:Rod binding domain-containing protein
MSNNIAPVSSALAAIGTTGSNHEPRADKIRHAATEFETILVKQLLKAAKLGGPGGDEKANGYADMAVDALASGIEQGGGLGLARRLEEALSTRSHADPAVAGAAATPARPVGEGG